MSAQHDTPRFVDDRDRDDGEPDDDGPQRIGELDLDVYLTVDCVDPLDDDDDPHGIVPTAFRIRYSDCDSIRDALRRAEGEARAKAHPERPRCPECGTTNIVHKGGTYEATHKRPEGFRCRSCSAHFNTPRESLEAERRGEQVTFEEVRADE